MRPMLASPTQTPPQGESWRHEIKWDGIRAIVTVTEGAVRIATRSGNDCTPRFPEITRSHLADYEDLVLDGEIVSFIDGAADFRAVMHRLTPGGMRGSHGVRTPAEQARLEAGSLRFMAFDVLRAAGHDVTRLPWHARRTLLEGVGLAGSVINVPETYADGQALLAATAEQGIEGIVSKNVESAYRPGVRSEDWLKCVNRQTDSFAVVGWRPVAGTTATVGALLLGQFVDGKLRFRGRVGTGISGAMGASLLEVLTPTPVCVLEHPDDDISEDDRIGTHWVRPTVVVDVSYLGKGEQGRLRQPSYKGLRLDLGPQHA